jgi:methionyl-tRNA formyltransferase
MDAESRIAPNESVGQLLRLVLMGTGPFAVPMFERLLAANRSVLALVTRPDRPVHARGSAVRNPMRELAQKHGLPVFEPADVNSPEARERLAEAEADLFVVCDYGQILSHETLALARLGGINLHGSLLPKYRGAAPIQWAIYHGEAETGVSVIHMTPRLDAGPVLVRRATPIGPTETAAELEPRLAALGADAVDDALALLSSSLLPGGKPLAGIVQEQSLASKAPRLKKTDGLVHWHRPAAAIFNQFRAFQPWPKVYSFWHPADEPPMRLVLDSIAVRPAIDSANSSAIGSARPGVVVGIAPELIVACGDGCLAIERIQAAGKRSMSALEFMHGHAIRIGDKFTDDDSSTTDSPGRIP